jgi:hypothetical protein
MSDEVATRIVVFVFVTAVIVTVAAWASVSYWIGARAAERKDRERSALLRHLAGQPAESVRLVLDKIREDDAAQAEGWRKIHEKSQRDAAAATLPFGLITIAASIGLSIFLYSVADSDEKGVWTLGLIPLLVGLVITGGAVYGKRKSRNPAGEAPGSTDSLRRP